MQTFVPYPDLQLTVSCLDRQRLGKQRVEAFQILNCLTGNGGKSWVRHPAVKMWRGYEDFLQLYMNQCIQEWIRRGYKNTMKLAVIRKPKPPFWWESEIHATHRAALLFKDFEWYQQFGWEENPIIKYFWPGPANSSLSF